MRLSWFIRVLTLGMTLVPAGSFAASPDLEIRPTSEFTYVIVGRPAGALQLELHNVIHDPVDLAISLLVRCGPHESLMRRHHEFLAHQQAILDQVTPERLESWKTGAITERTVRIAGDLGLFERAAELGIPRAEASACLRDQTDIQHLTNMTDAALKSGVEATPMFRLNGELQNGIYVWKALKPLVMQAVRRRDGHLVQLVEYVSYTCPHCARFELESADDRDHLLTSSSPHE